ncbi:hypothetical protein [Streptomyces atroolivaceus]|uniref:hypothetical protein n=1 Tax=Streptomyces atroolivaceus TaxID=66869 RepID=UPI00363E9F1D
MPNTCVLHPERVVEHEYLGLLEEELQEEIDEWEEGLLDKEEEDEVEPLPSASYATYEKYAEAMAAAQAEEPEEISYMSDLSIAPPAGRSEALLHGI